MTLFFFPLKFTSLWFINPVLEGPQDIFAPSHHICIRYLVFLTGWELRESKNVDCRSLKNGLRNTALTGLKSHGAQQLE